MKKSYEHSYLDPSVEYLQALLLFYNLLDESSRMEIFDHCKSLFVSLINENTKSPIQTSRFLMVFHYFICSTYAADAAYLAKQVVLLYHVSHIFDFVISINSCHVRAIGWHYSDKKTWVDIPVIDQIELLHLESCNVCTFSSNASERAYIFIQVGSLVFSHFCH